MAYDKVADIESEEHLRNHIQDQFGMVTQYIPGTRKLLEGRVQGHGRVVFIWTPWSRTHRGGLGWVDYTEVQRNHSERYAMALGVIRLDDGNNVYLDLRELEARLRRESMMSNSREGNFWRLFVHHTDQLPHIDIAQDGQFSIQTNREAMLEEIIKDL